MPLFNASQTFRDVRGVRIVTFKLNGGTVSVLAEHEPDVFVPVGDVTADGTNTIDFSGPAVRIAVAGGATYAFKTRD